MTNFEAGQALAARSRAAGKGGKGGGNTKSLQSFYGSGKTSEESKAIWDGVYKQNVKNRLNGRGQLQMPAERPGRRRCAPGDREGNAALNKAHEAFLTQLKLEATHE